MSNVQNLSNLIRDGVSLDLNIINSWELVIPLLRNNHIVRTSTITGVIAEKYRYDYIGLLNYMGVAPEYHYPHIRANGYHSSKDFLGDELTVDILDNSRLVVFLRLFTK